MIVAVPPEPVGALGDIELVPGLRQTAGSCLPERSSLDEERAGGVQRVPAPVIFGMADPDGEVVADPASGEQVVQRIVRGMVAEKLADLDRPDLPVAGGGLVERTEERHPAVRVVFPAVLAVENDRDERRRIMAAGVADRRHLAHEVGGRDRARDCAGSETRPGRTSNGREKRSPARAPPLAPSRRDRAARDGGRGPGCRGRPCHPSSSPGSPRRSRSTRSRARPGAGSSAWQTEPSLGHMPRGGSPKRRVWLSTARRTCAAASSG